MGKREVKEMRKLGLLIVVIAALALVPGVSWAAITGTPHDLSGRGWGTNQICIFCHTPHNSASGANQIVPLWNHGTTAATFTLYSSPSLNAVPGQPAGNSKACLSCHDGTVALDTYGARTGTNFISTGLLGTDISNDHPVSFTYNAALATADGGLVTPASDSLVVAGIPLFASQLECASCHAVHDNANGDFLRTSNAASALCLKCHTK
jgi:predicted CXXCH cytochrome family protein